jgi:hypothetical protein
MSRRKVTMQGQIAQAIQQVNPYDRVITTLYAIEGPSPWLTAVVSQGLIGALIGQLFVNYYFVTVTEQAVVFHRADRLLGRPKEMVMAFPRQQAAMSISDYRRNAVWSSFRFHLPGQEKPSRINVHRQWRPELDQFMWGLTGMPIPTA